MNTALELLRILGPGLGVFVAMKVELRWLRTDLTEVKETAKDHSIRIRKLEIDNHG